MVFRALAVVGLVALVLWWLERPPRNPDNICAIFAEKPGWYASSRRSFERWGVPEAVQLAIIYQESSFRARARPPRRKILRIIPWRRPSSAYGYAQVLDSTWGQFRHDTGRASAARSRFEDVAQFVGWYGEEIRRLTGIAKDDSYCLYLAYHDGPNGYLRGSHNSKLWLLEVARKVESRARAYQRQYDACEDRLWWLWLRCWVGRLVLVGLALWLYLRWRRRSGRRRR